MYQIGTDNEWNAFYANFPYKRPGFCAILDAATPTG